jgi:hypothetical protein
VHGGAMHDHLETIEKRYSSLAGAKYDSRRTYQ